VQLQRRGTLSFNLSRSSSWRPGFREPWNIFAVCSHTTVRCRCYCPDRVDSYVYSRRPNRRPEDQDFEEEERRGVAGGIFKQRGIGPTGSNHAASGNPRPATTDAFDLLRLLREIFSERCASVALPRRADLVYLSDFVYLSRNPGAGESRYGNCPTMHKFHSYVASRCVGSQASNVPQKSPLRTSVLSQSVHQAN
jgi:hypothetical protein